MWSLHDRIVLKIDDTIKGQSEDHVLKKLTKKVSLKQRTNYALRNDRALIKYDRLCVPNDPASKSAILEEAHSLAYAMHPRSSKMYRILKGYYWWLGMKCEIVEFVAKFLICQQVKLLRQKPRGLLNPFHVP